MYQALCEEPETQEVRNMDTSMFPGCCFSTRKQLSMTMGFPCAQGKAIMRGLDPERVGTGGTWTGAGEASLRQQPPYLVRWMWSLNQNQPGGEGGPMNEESALQKPRAGEGQYHVGLFFSSIIRFHLIVLIEKQNL